MKRIYVWKKDLAPPSDPHAPHKVEILRLDSAARVKVKASKNKGKK